MCYKPYPVCYGRKFRYVQQLNKPLVVIFETWLCNNNKFLTEIKKSKFVQYIIKLFYKDSRGMSTYCNLNKYKECRIESGDELVIVFHVTKAVINKLLDSLGYV